MINSKQLGGSELMINTKKLSLIFLGIALALGVGAGLSVNKVESAKAETKSIAVESNFNPIENSDEPFVPTTTYLEATMVTDIATLEAGDQIVIGVKDKDAALGPAEGDHASKASIVLLDDDIVNLGISIIFTLGGSSDAWTFHSEAGYLYFSGISKTLNFGEAPTSGDTWTITLSSDNVATIKNNANTSFSIQYNPGSPRFGCYATTQTKPNIFKIGPTNSGYNYDYLLDILKGDYCNKSGGVLDLINTRYEAMAEDEKTNFNSEEILGNNGTTYTGEEAYTAAMIRRTFSAGEDSKNVFNNAFEQNEIVMLIVILSLICISGIAGSLFIYRRKQRK